MRESLLDAALSPGLAAAGPRAATPLAVVRAPRALGALSQEQQFLVCPLTGKEKTIGFLLLGRSAHAPSVATHRATAAATLAAHAAAAVSRVESFLLSVTTLAAAIDSRDPGGANHSRRVRDLCMACAKTMGLSDARRETLAIAALLHDVGKLSVPDHILGKPGRLDAQEFADIAAHTTTGAHLAGHSFGEVMPFILCHHERWDGTGYPAGLRGEQIPVEAQIIAVCEAWDAMRIGRPYRPALAPDAARRELEAASGTQFSPAVVAAFLANGETAAPIMPASLTTGAARAKDLLAAA